MREEFRAYKARDLAEILALDASTDVEPEDIAEWPLYDVEEWLECWGFTWNGTTQIWENNSL